MKCPVPVHEVEHWPGAVVVVVGVGAVAGVVAVGGVVVVVVPKI